MIAFSTLGHDTVSLLVKCPEFQDGYQDQYCGESDIALSISMLLTLLDVEYLSLGIFD